MNKLSSLRFLLGASLLCMSIGLPANAQEKIRPVDEPRVGAAPTAPSDASPSYDSVAIQQLMKLVSLSRLIGGGISEVVGSIEAQKDALESIQKGQSGPKNFPLLNGPDEVEGRKGGEGLRELSEGALNGSADGPPSLVEALTEFRKTFSLDQAFELKDDELPGKKMMAQLAAKSAIAASSAENAYKQANLSNLRLNDYIAALESSPDLKTSIDLNTRVMIELTQQSNESLRTQSAITSIVSTYLMVLASEASEKSWVDGLKNFNR
ncbi:hypothetical protein N183_36175 [Sinorhizobium sp. Sb3]|uniref:type IV secretion system protein n=1 Tax=Sinorhizobium sp. Sb3 TaxID=1358417 RepID=UPI000723C230|nr:type IV secretion system protein [Sinorhizobium sp. Sb3]KSV63167.1 hypothetical protein N183_36175 [Sinorhizobium sp. Sb3]